MMFQCNSGAIAKLYGKLAPFPHGHVVAHELFKYFLWKAASTDWSTFLKYGSPGMKGLDTAYIENGYVYHTSKDVLSAIPSKFAVSAASLSVLRPRVPASQFLGPWRVS